MKYAFLILAHEDPENLRRLVHALDDPHFDIFIHVDEKADISAYQFERYALRHSCLTVLENRVSTYWGDMSLVDAMLAMYRRARQTQRYDRYITLSGLDYPLRSNKEILEALSDPRREFILARPLREDLSFKIRGVYIWKYHILARIARRLVAKYGIVMHPEKLRIRKSDREKSPVWFSSQWHALSGEFVDYMLKTLEENQRILRFFRFSYAPDELLIPTILFNSPFAARAIPGDFPENQDFEELFISLPAVHYLRRANSNVVVFREEDYDTLMNSGKLFCRKVRTGVSDGLLDRIDRKRTHY